MYRYYPVQDMKFCPPFRIVHSPWYHYDPRAPCLPYPNQNRISHLIVSSKTMNLGIHITAPQIIFCVKEGGNLDGLALGLADGSLLTALH